ncbi:CDC48 family AAA ATPase [Candidatus Woesearchaeota archaeon]|nr:CDC48 family AAA ATPase [Candidatus Woesearchaeota archaeon]
MTQQEISLKVQEALQEEAYKGIVRIDAQTMRQIDVRAGDIIEIEGGRKTVGIVDRSYPSDIGQTIIRMDGILRRNAKTGIGETVKVRKLEVREAKSITIAPAQQGVMIQANNELFKQGLLGRAVVKGDIISLGGARRRRRTLSGSNFDDIFNVFEEGFMGNFGFGSLKFIVAETTPKTAVIITENTEVKVSSKAVQVTEERVPDVTYEDIGGLEEEIKKLREMVELPIKNPEIFERLGVEPPKGVLLYGPPGTGKTLLAKAVANESEANFLLVNGPELTSKFYGETEKRIRDLFEEAEKNAPSIIFIDEIDALAPKRDETYGEVERRMVSQLLTVMDGLKSRGRVVVIGATNRPNSIDPALRRPGRFDREISIGVPNKAGRLNVLKIHTRNMPIEGQLDKEIMGKELLHELESYLKENKIEREKTEQQLNDLKLKKAGEKSLLDKLTNVITGLISKIEKIEGYHELFIKKDKLNELITEISQIETNKVKIEEGEARSILLEKKKAKLSENYEIIIKDLKEFKIINSNFFNKIRDKSAKKDLERLADITHGFVGADLQALCKEAAMNVIRRVLPDLKGESEKISPEVLAKLVITAEDFRAALKIVRPSALREVLIERPTTTWEDVGGLQELKQQLKEAVEWPLKNPKMFSRLGIKPPRGILIYGPPGTGKTMLARAVAHESEANFISVKGPEVLSKWVGESEKAVRKIFEKARQTAPTIIFFDEIDAVAPRRGTDSGSNVTERIVNTMLVEMDGLEELADVVVIAATNRPDLVDPSLLRPGRFDRVIAAPMPGKDSRLAILKVHIGKMPLTKDVDIDKLAEKTEGYSGADIYGLVREAAMHALRKNAEANEVTAADFEEALKKVSPSLKEEDLKRYKDVEEKYLRKAKIASVVAQRPSYLG